VNSLAPTPGNFARRFGMLIDKFGTPWMVNFEKLTTDSINLIPVEACYLGWQDSLQNLAKLVEPDINQ